MEEIYQIETWNEPNERTHTKDRREKKVQENQLTNEDKKNIMYISWIYERGKNLKTTRQRTGKKQQQRRQQNTDNVHKTKAATEENTEKSKKKKCPARRSGVDLPI